MGTKKSRGNNFFFGKGAEPEPEELKPVESRTFRVLNLEIKFPFEPYGIQKAMMGKVSGSLMDQQHSLIESPTGTGKTLVLLCSALAWLKKSQALGQPFISTRLRKQRADERRERLKSRPCTCGRRPSRTELDELKEAKENAKCGKDCISKGSKERPFADLLSDDDELYCKKKLKTEPSSDLKSSPYFKKEKPECIILDDDDVVIIDDEPKKLNHEIEFSEKPEADAKIEKSLCRSCAAIQAEEKFTEVFGEDSQDGEGMFSNIKSKIPRIYYGTRTHKQITQVIRELNKTTYRENLRMCILSSRDRTCINEGVKDLTSRNDRCQELVRNRQNNGPMEKSKSKSDDTCRYYSSSENVAQIFESINIDFKSKAWDIEDAAKFGSNHEVCPYYGCRSLQEQADITFSPYNYLLDPTIRKTLNINLSNAIVIFDEAHNIEDICRDSASFVIDSKQIDDILDTIKIASNHYLKGSVIMDGYDFFQEKFRNLKLFIKNFQFSYNDRDAQEKLERKVIVQSDMLKQLKEIGLGPDCLPKVKENLKGLRGDDESESGEKPSKKSETSQPALSFNQMQFITQLAITLEFMYASHNKYLNDFRTVVSKHLDGSNPKGGSFKPNNQVELPGHENYIWKFSILCMNPGIAFEKIQSLAWSVIVASGTLSPIESLKSELGCTFLKVFEGSHVIKSERIFATIMSKGPNGHDLNCAYSSSLQIGFQDEVGEILRDVCRLVPNGILVFFPSYDRMERFYSRWMTLKIMTQIRKTGKILFKEPRNSSAAEFEKVLESYHENANNGGAILFAVFRGKVSEGIDFADKAARAVITIGIPYPNMKEVTIGLKKDYNDIARIERPHLMSGRDWYSSQAFRALNQALGRCIRHKDDWGAIIMIDSRLRNDYSVKSISRWLRQVLDSSNDYKQTHRNLEEFIELRTRED